MAIAHHLEWAGNLIAHRTAQAAALYRHFASSAVIAPPWNNTAEKSLRGTAEGHIWRFGLRYIGRHLRAARSIM
jgi:hypothetical protein